MLTVPRHTLCSWEHEIVTGGKLEERICVREFPGYRRCDYRVGNQRKVVAMLLEASDRKDRARRGPGFLIRMLSR